MLDQRRILAETPLESFYYFDSLASTNDKAKSLSDIKLPSLIVAGEQTAGRGQRSNHWWSDRGSLTASWVFDSSREIPTSLLALATGVATANAIACIDESLKIRTKWPNDVYLDNAKVAGILVESGNGRLIVGVGINTNTDIDKAPPQVQQRATSLSSKLNRCIDHEFVIISLSNALHLEMNRLATAPKILLAHFQALSIFQVDSTLSLVTRDGKSHQGKFAGFGSHGELLLNMDSKTHKFFSATIEEF